MRPTGLLMITFANNLAIFYQHGTDIRIGAGGIAAKAGQLYRLRHKGCICRTKHQAFSPKRAISSPNSRISLNERYTEAKRI